ncbi:enoyl-CoA hydratase-related protein [Agrobacterium vitis]|uniref:Enoyl-CoA hydratase/isomerase family protein n=1 Tax=Agrobacterium vitis TaxID=373 RepID=A0AAE2UXB4_AGRVI|nr:enoyl-CoA hydratase-related protein [Agrobacterium vitis]MBF2715879.1 enoyl-CoA hydratase/isomerase family protein [Agrobacterium vitis]MUZ65685.1 enoyl-CoA hydratase [Agrobacterium vitis]MVA21039.1 enoyl-CoA hydratase [Agrobacterium vitis]
MKKARTFANNGIRVAGQNGIGALIIDNPTRKNAITQAMWRAIPPALDWLIAEAGVHCIVMTGGGQTDFSAGADISEFDAVRNDSRQARIYEADNSAAFSAIRESRVPVIASLRGVCYGGAFGLAAAADLRIADDTAIFAIPAARLGLAYPADAVADLSRTLGSQIARRALFTGQAFPAASLLSCGFLGDLVAPQSLDGAAFSLAETIAANAPLSIHAAKLALRATESQDDSLLSEAAVLGSTTFESADYREGRAAFREKRQPIFTGE